MDMFSNHDNTKDITYVLVGGSLYRLIFTSSPNIKIFNTDRAFLLIIYLVFFSGHSHRLPLVVTTAAGLKGSKTQWH